MLNPIKMLEIFVQKTLPEVFDDSLSYYEAVAKLKAKINEIAALYNGAIEELFKKEDSIFLSVSRKLSKNGDFSGTLLGRTIFSVFADINNSLSLVTTLISMVNGRESIGMIYDGGAFNDLIVPPIIIIEGGIF